ncbi:MAG: PadR family transcriptional regulator [Rhodospirillales bacterium]|nr:PadR family transcriptional regulator [Rhodospirillales bacterium]
MFGRSRHRGPGEEGERRHARGDFGFGGRHFGGHHGGRHGWGGGGRMGRLFEQGDLRFLILTLIAEKPRHGYEIIKEIEDKLMGLYSPSPGVIYPTLTLLEEMGYATVAQAEGNKKLYAITDEGRAFLASNQSVMTIVLEKIAEVKRRFGGGIRPQIQRAVENFKLALQMRLAKEPLTDEQVQRITAIIDAAAADIERV